MNLLDLVCSVLKRCCHSPSKHTYYKRYPVVRTLTPPSAQFPAPTMSSINRGESDPHSSEYEGDISDQVSEASAVANSDTVDEGSSETGEINELETGTIWIGCDVRDAGPGVQSDEDAEFGTIVIGCSIRDMGFESYQAYLNADDQATVEHIENVDEIADVEHSSTAAIDANNKKLMS
ncbi:hypothetical protein BDV09DRAFT_110109 [Aspergillus tetrazonus]